MAGEESHWTKVAGRQLTRRGLLQRAALGGVGAVGFALVGCSSGNNTKGANATSAAGPKSAASGTQTAVATAPGGSTPVALASGTAGASAAQPKRGGKVVAVVNSSQNYLSVNPAAPNVAQMYAHFGNASILDNEHLVRYDWNDPKQFVFLLAEKIEQPDSTTYIAHLRPGARFSDGNPVTAEDAKFALDRLNPKLLSTPFPGPLAVFPSSEAVDATTIKVTLDKPFPDFYQELAGALGIPLSKKSYATAADPWGFADDRQAHPITAAPFKVTNFRPRETINVSRFDGYWGGQKYLDEIDLPAIGEDATRVNLLRTGEAQLIGNVPPQDSPDLEKDKSFVIDSRPGVKIQHLWYNGLRAPFGPPSEQTRAFRCAMYQAVDRESLIKNIWLGKGRVGDSWLMPFQFGYQKQTVLPYDPKAAKQLLTQAGWDFNYTVRFLGTQGAFTADKAYIEAAAQMLQAIGVKVNLNIIADYSTFVQTVVSNEPDNLGKWDIAITNVSRQPLASRLIWNYFRQDNTLSHYNNSQLLDLVNAQLIDPNNDTRAQKVGQIQKIINDECAMPSLTEQFYTIGWRKELQGVALTQLEGWDLRDAWLNK